MPKERKHDRLLIFDILRIVAVLLIIWSHVSGRMGFLHTIFNPDVSIFGLFTIEAGFIGVVLFLFVSGACLEYSYGQLKALPQIIDFYKKRVLRIYPVFWLSMIAAFIIDIKDVICLDLQHIIVNMLGLQMVFNMGWGPNLSTWFVGLIVMLYLLYPFISYALSKNAYLVMALLIFIGLVSRYILYGPGFPQYATLGAPICWLAEFGLGIYVIKLNLFPAITNRSYTIKTLSDMGFYAFLINGPLLVLLPIGYVTVIELATYITLLIVFSMVLYQFDRSFKSAIKIGNFKHADMPTISKNITI